MSCYDRYPHGCDWPVVPPDHYDGYGYRPRRYRDEVAVVREDDDDWGDEPPRRRRSRRRRADHDTGEVTAVSLESRAEALRAELIRIEEDLARLSPGSDPASET